MFIEIDNWRLCHRNDAGIGNLPEQQAAVVALIVQTAATEKAL